LSDNNLKLSFGWDFKTIIGILLSIIALVWAFHNYHLDDYYECNDSIGVESNFFEKLDECEDICDNCNTIDGFINTLKKINYLYIFIACISIIISVWFRAIRWKLLINSDKINIKQLFNIEMVGYFGNNVLPLRAGEIYRGILLSNKIGKSKSYSLGTIALERMTDMMGLIILFGLLFLFYPLPAELELWGTRVIIFSFSIVIVMLSLKIIFKSKIKLILKGGFISQFINGFSEITFKNFLKVLGWTLIIWFTYWFDTYLIQKAFDLNMTWEQILLVLIWTSLAMAIPSAPGMIGVYHMAVIQAMLFIGFNNHISMPYSIILHAYGFLTLTAVGAYYFLMLFKKEKL
jgi:glycosyltransferase 2 family protein